MRRSGRTHVAPTERCAPASLPASSPTPRTRHTSSAPPPPCRPSYTRRGGSHAIWFDPELGFWHLGSAQHRGSGQGWLHAHAPDAWTAEAIRGPWSLARAPPADPEDEPPPLEGGGGQPRPLRGTLYVDVPLRCDPASVELTGALPDSMLGGAQDGGAGGGADGADDGSGVEGSDVHGARGYFGIYDLYERSPVNGRPAYVQRGTQATRALWYAPDAGYWHFGPFDAIGTATGPTICAQDERNGVGGPERLQDAGSWQVNDGASWVRAPAMRCRVAR